MKGNPSPTYTIKELNRFAELLEEASYIVEEMTEDYNSQEKSSDDQVSHLIKTIIMLKLRIVAVKYRE